MLVAVVGEKGAPGATTLAVLLGAVWPGECVVAELDLRGASLPYRMLRVDGQPLARTPSVASLAVDARPGARGPLALDSYAQRTQLGVLVIPGLVAVPNEVDAAGQLIGPRARANLARQLPAIAAAGQQWAGAMLADLGALLPGSPALSAARAAQLTLLVTRPSTEGLGRLWEQAGELIQALGDPDRERLPLGVVLVAGQQDARAGEDRARAVLQVAGLSVPVLGTIDFDAKAAAQLWQPGWHHKPGQNPLVRSAQHLLERIFALWPETTDLARFVAHPHACITSPDDPLAQAAPETPLLGWPAAREATR